VVREAIGRSPRRPDDEQDFALAATQYRLPTSPRRVAERGESLWELDAATPSLQLKLIGQHQNTVLLAEGRGGLYVVDQHRAHERVIYEQLSARQAEESAGPSSAQYMLEPIVMEVSPGRAEVLGDRLSALEALGFSCERFGGHSFLVRSTPDVPDATRKATLEEVLEEASDERDDWRERLLIRLACRSAIRRGRALTLPEATRLLEQLSRANTPAVCPHGAPIVLHFGRKFLERQFSW
jgi:DNA mismatch repair protein MutL